MKSTEGSVPGQVERAGSQQRNVETGILQCLVSSTSQTRRNMLTQAASDAGWRTIVCSSPEKSLGEFRRSLFQFAMIDFDDRGGTPPGVRKLVQTLAQNSSKILIGICGHEADPEEEIWVRQLGIWLYLPGTTTSSEVSLLCEQALRIVTRQRDEQLSVS